MIALCIPVKATNKKYPTKSIWKMYSALFAVKISICSCKFFTAGCLFVCYFCFYIFWNHKVVKSKHWTFLRICWLILLDKELPNTLSRAIMKYPTIWHKDMESFRNEMTRGERIFLKFKRIAYVWSILPFASVPIAAYYREVWKVFKILKILLRFRYDIHKWAKDDKSLSFLFKVRS